MSSIVRVRYHGVVFELDLDVIREAITRRELTDGVTLGQVAERAGVSRMAIWRLLDRQRVSLLTLRRILTALELNPGNILRTPGPSSESSLAQPSPRRSGQTPRRILAELREGWRGWPLRRLDAGTQDGRHKTRGH